MTDPDNPTGATVEPMPATTAGEVTIAEDLHVVVFFTGSPRALSLMIPPAEAAALVEVASANGLNRPDSVEVHDDQTQTVYTLTADMICAVGVPAVRAQWRLLLDSTAEGAWEFMDVDLLPKEGREIEQTSAEGFQSMIIAAGPADRPPAWLRKVTRGALRHGVRYQLERLEA